MLRVRILDRTKYALMLLRHHLGLVLLPVLFVALLHDLENLIVPGYLSDGQSGIGYAIGLVGFLICLPLVVARIWPTEPLPAGAIRRRLENVASRSQFTYRDLLLWKTDHRIVNAAVLGLVGRLRYVLLSDGLLARLTDDEVEAVFTHEMGHIRRHHLWFRLLIVIQPINLYLIGLFVISRAMPEAISVIQSWTAPAIVQFGFLLPILASYGIIVFGWFSRFMELDADAFAFRQLGLQYIAALERLAADAGASRDRQTWLHPSLDHRIEFLNQVARQPRDAHSVARRLSAFRSFFLVSSALAAISLLA